MRGWNPRFGIPREGKLEELGLRYVSEDLKRNGVELLG